MTEKELTEKWKKIMNNSSHLSLVLLLKHLRDSGDHAHADYILSVLKKRKQLQSRNLKSD